MASDQITPAAGPSVSGTPSTGAFAAQGFDLQRYGMEVAREIGVDPTNLGAYGLSAPKIDAYEAQTHSGNRRGNRKEAER